MSENNQDNTPEVIESEIVQIPETNEDSKPVVIKKGGFISFVAFLLSASALTASAYLYVQLQKDTGQAIDNAWQEPIANVRKNTDQKFSQLSNQIKQIQKTNSELQQQLKKIETIAANMKPSENNGTSEKYDDSKIQQRLIDLQNQLNSQNQSLNQIQKIVKNNNTQHNQSIDKINQKLDKPEVQTDGLTLINRNYQYELAEHLLKAANEQFSIYGNVSKGQEFLSKTLKQMSTLEGEDYQNLAKEIKKVADELSNNPPIDVVEINKQIDQLADVSSQLKLNPSITDENKKDQEQSSWYDKLIVIRKVDANSDNKLSTSEQQNILSDLENHFGMMKLALMSNKQTLWQQEISAIETLLNEYFPTQSDNIKQQLIVLKDKDINPKLPDLLQYLEAIQALNNVEFTQAEIPYETHLTVEPTNDSSENK